jgi:hypothetical protein
LIAFESGWVDAFQQKWTWHRPSSCLTDVYFSTGKGENQ